MNHRVQTWKQGVGYFRQKVMVACLKGIAIVMKKSG